VTSPTLDHYDGNLLNFVACRPRCARICLRLLRLARVEARSVSGSGRAAAIWHLDAVSRRGDASVGRPLKRLFAPIILSTATRTLGDFASLTTTGQAGRSEGSADSARRGSRFQHPC